MSSSEHNSELSDRLERAGWSEQVYRRLCDAIESVPAQQAVAVFDFDNTCILGDIGESFGQFLVETMRYRYDLEEFWDQIAPGQQRKRLRSLTERALQLDPRRRDGSPVYRRYVAEMAALYGRRLERLGRRACYEWAVRLHVGLTPGQMRRWSRTAIRRQLHQPRSFEHYHTADGRRVRIQRGIRPFAEIRQLIQALHQIGWQVWIVSATNAWTVREFAAIFGVDSSRVLGNRVTVEQGRLTATTDPPVLYREGKVAAIDEAIGRRPAVVFGDSVTDFEMLCEAEYLAVVVDCGDELLRREGPARGWAFQPQEALTPEQRAAGIEPGEL